MLKQKFDRTRGNCPRVQQFCSTCQDIRDIKIWDITSFLPKKVRNVQATIEFVWEKKLWEIAYLSFRESTVDSIWFNF